MEPVAYEIMERIGDTHWWYRARREIIADVIEREVPPGSRIIDFGSGTGATAVLLRNRGYQVAIAEISVTALESCRRRGVPVIDLRTDSLPERAADCVLLGDVLEHVENDAALLREVRKALLPGGLIVVTVPAYMFLWSGEDHVSRHLRRYRLPGLVATLDNGGFAVKWASYFNTLLFPAIVAVRILKRAFRPHAMYESDVTPLWRPLNIMLYGLFRAEAVLLRRVSMPFGASIIVLASPKSEPSRQVPVTCPVKINSRNRRRSRASTYILLQALEATRRS
jgi:SAM-dependent methyltransferase